VARASAFVGGLVLGLALGTMIMVSHADDVSAEVSAAAAAAHVDPVQLQGALNTLEAQGLPSDAYGYLRSEGELPPLEKTKEPPPGISQSYTSQASARVQCIIRVESEGNPRAVNARSGASGLGQFLSSTWKTTPQGRSGLSVFDASANTAAINWMISVGRAAEFDAVRFHGC